MPSNPISIPRRVGYFLGEHLRMLGWVFGYLVAHRAWGVAPLVMLLLVLGLFVFASTNPAVSPFLYALF